GARDGPDGGDSPQTSRAGADDRRGRAGRGGGHDEEASRDSPPLAQPCRRLGGARPPDRVDLTAKELPMIPPRPGLVRRGYSLVEIVLAMGAVAIVLGLCAGLLHVLLRLDRTGRTHLVESATIGRLARQFREDVHASRRAVASAAGDAPAAMLEL